MKKITVMIITAVVFFYSVSFLRSSQIDREYPVYVSMPQRGDIIVFGSPIVKQGDPDYRRQMYLSYFEELARSIGLYDSFWGRDFFTWDNTSEPIGTLHCWGHIEIITEDGGQENIDNWASGGQSFVILRLKPETGINPEDVAVGFEDLMENYIGGNQPFLGALVLWLKKEMKENNIDWIKEDYTFDLWYRLYGIDFKGIPDFNKLQEYFTTDITDWLLFTQRTVSCSSLTSWAIIYGWNERQKKSSKKPFFVRDLFINNPKAIMAIDGTAPGQIARFLVEKGWADIIVVSYSTSETAEKKLKK
ncbi:MAG: hypothetical protein K9M15_00515 [Candidatus Marinimicrobia bacterium]|nr:hypothetical protein [Candidatus Neomarinimicrobiota bacterium]